MDGFDPSRHCAGLAPRNVAVRVVMEVNLAALPVSNLFFASGIACALITRTGYRVDRKSDLVGLRMKLRVVMPDAGINNVW